MPVLFIFIKVLYYKVNIIIDISVFKNLLAK